MPHPLRSPSFAVPEGACDCHFHVFASTASYPFTPERSYTPGPAPLSAYRDLQSTLGIQRGVLVQPSVYGTDNRLLIDVLRENRDLRGVAVVDDRVSDHELSELHRAGVRGIRINTFSGAGVDVELLERLAQRVAGLGWHIQLFVSGRKVAELEERILELPVHVVFDHLGNVPASEGIGAAGFRSLLRMLASGRVWVKLSGAYRVTEEGPPYRDTIAMARALVEAAPERAVWGSDWPHPKLDGRPEPDDTALLDLLASWAPDAAVRKRILVDNPAHLYDFT